MSWFALAQVLATRAALAPFEAALNRLLRMDPETLERLSMLSGQVIALEVQPFSLRLYFVPGTAGVVLSSEERTPDVLLCGTPLTLLRLLTGTGSPVLFSGEVQITGDIELAQRLRTILGRLDVDWEEGLSTVLGDIGAHQVGRGVRGALAWGGQAWESLTLTLSEYLQEEARLCPNQEEAEDFLTQIDTVRMDVDRLEQRVRRLQAHIVAGETPASV